MRDVVRGDQDRRAFVLVSESQGLGEDFMRDAFRFRPAIAEPAQPDRIIRSDVDLRDAHRDGVLGNRSVGKHRDPAQENENSAMYHALFIGDGIRE